MTPQNIARSFQVVGVILSFGVAYLRFKHPEEGKTT